MSRMSRSNRLYKAIERFARDEEGSNIIGTLLDFVLLIILILVLVEVVPILLGWRDNPIDELKRDWNNYWKGVNDWFNGLFGRKPTSTEEADVDLDSFTIALAMLKEEQALPFSSGGNTYVARVREFDPTDYGYHNLKSIDFYTAEEWAGYTAKAKARNEQYFLSNPVAFTDKVGDLIERDEGWTYVTSDGQVGMTTSGKNVAKVIGVNYTEKEVTPELVAQLASNDDTGFLSATMSFYVSDVPDEQFVNDLLALEEGDRITYLIGIVPYNIFPENVVESNSGGRVTYTYNATLGYGSIEGRVSGGIARAFDAGRGQVRVGDYLMDISHEKDHSYNISLTSMGGGGSV